MAEEAAEEGGEGEGGGGGKKKLLLIVIPIVLLVLVGGGAGAYFAGLFGGGEEHAESEDGEHAEGEGEEHAEEVSPEEKEQAAVEAAATGLTLFYDLPEMLVNLNTGGKQSSFLKIKVSLELANAADQKKIEEMLPRVVDNFQVYLRELRLEDLEGSRGMFRLKEELLMRVNTAVKPVVINDVLFKEMLVH